MTGVLIRLMPLNPVTGERIEVCASSFGKRSEAAANGKDGRVWEPCITTRPKIGMTLWNGGFDEPISPAGATFPLNLAVLAKTYPGVQFYAWMGAPIEVFVGEPGALWPWPTIFKGVVSGYGGTYPQFTLEAKVNTEPFEQEVLTASYAGTGDAEGAADIKNRAKPLVLGHAKNVEPVFINTIDNIYQFSAYGPIEAVDALFERGSDFGASLGDYPAYADLLAATIDPGKWATCLAEGLIRLGAPASGVITGDVRGHVIGSTTPRLTGEIIDALAGMASVPPDLVDAASLAAIDSARPYPVNLVITNNSAKLLDWVQRLALACNWQAAVGPDGVLFLTHPDLGDAEVFTLDAQGKASPQVLQSDEIDVSPPYAKTTLGAARSWRVHTADEISFYAEVIYTGRYDDTKTYREGMVVNLIDGSEWIYVSAVPGAGNPPPIWPATSNDWWENMTPPSDIVGAQVAIRTAAIRRPRTTADIPRQMLIGTTDGGGVSSISVARHDWDYPNGSADVIRELAVIPSLAPATDYYVYFDDSTLADLNPVYAVETDSALGENSTLHPYRHPLGKITTPAIGADPTYGGAVPGYGYQVLVDGAAQIATNFNARNDQNPTAIVVPVVAGDGTAVDHTINPNANADVSFEWAWSGAEEDIDGFEVMLYGSASSPAYTPGTTPAAENVWIVPPNKRAVIVRGVLPTLHLTFAVRAFRVVDPNIDIDQRMQTPWIKSTATGENPYQPDTQVAWGGDITGTIDGVPVEDVSEAVLNFNARNDQDGTAIVTPVVLTDGTAVDHVIQANGSADLSFEWTWSGSNDDIDGWELVMVGTSNSITYTIGSTPVIEMSYRMPPNRRAFLAFGVSPDMYYTFYVRAFRIVDPNINAAEVIYSTWVKSTLAAENPYRPASSVAFAGNITGTVNGMASTTLTAAATNFNARNDRNAAAIPAATVATNGTAVDHTDNANASVDISFEWTWSGNNADIDGWDVMVYSAASASAYTPGATPANETIYRIPPDKRAFFLLGVQPTLYYTFAVRAFRTVDPDINASGFIYGAWVKPSIGSENPYQPSVNTAFTGNLTGTVNGTAASAISSAAVAANNGLNADGTVKNGKVGTAAILNQALIASGYTAQGATIVFSPGEAGGLPMVASLSVQGSRLVVDFVHTWALRITNPVQGNFYSYSLKGWIELISSGADTFSMEWSESIRWDAPTATGTFDTGARTTAAQFVFNAPGAGAYRIGYWYTIPATNGLIDYGYRYIKGNDLRATE